MDRATESIFSHCGNLASTKARALHREADSSSIFVNRMALCDRPPHMHNAFSAILGLIAPICLAATISNAAAAPPAKAAEDRYIAARDAAIEKFRQIYDAGNVR